MNPFLRFKANLLRHGLEYFGLFYGFYEGQVYDNEDPENRGRIQVICPSVYGDKPYKKWVMPMGMFSGKGIGFYAIPQKNDPIWITCKRGDPEYPIWTYGWYPQKYSPEGVSPSKFMFITPSGYKLTFDEKDSKIELYFNDEVNAELDKDHIILNYKNNNVDISDKLSVNFGGENMLAILSGFVDSMINSIVTTPAGPGNFAPNTLAALNEIKVKLNTLMQ